MKITNSSYTHNSVKDTHNKPQSVVRNMSERLDHIIHNELRQTRDAEKVMTKTGTSIPQGIVTARKIAKIKAQN